MMWHQATKRTEALQSGTHRASLVVEIPLSAATLEHQSPGANRATTHRYGVLQGQGAYHSSIRDMSKLLAAHLQLQRGRFLLVRICCDFLLLISVRAGGLVLVDHRFRFLFLLHEVNARRLRADRLLQAQNLISFLRSFPRRSHIRRRPSLLPRPWKACEPSRT